MRTVRSEFGVLLSILVLAGASLVPGASGDASTLTIERPVLTPGDYWTYNVTLFNEGDNDSVGTMRADVIGPDNTTLGGQVYPTYHLRVNTTMAQGGPELGPNVTTLEDEWLTADMIVARTLRVEDAWEGPVTYEKTVVPPPSLPWPIRQGLAWTTTANISLNQSWATGWAKLTSRVTQTWNVGGAVLREAPAGEFTVLRMTSRTENGFRRVTYWAGDVGEWVAEETYDAFGVQLSSIDLTGYSYQGPPEIVLTSGPPSILVLAILGVALGLGVLASAIGFVRRHREREFEKLAERVLGHPAEPAPLSSGSAESLGGESDLTPREPPSGPS